MRDSLSSNKFVDSYFNTHSQGGKHNIREKWMNYKTWRDYLLPAPFPFFDEYFSMRQNISFESLTCLRQYLGEKIAYYFAWKSFLTCSYAITAIPGLLLQLYIWATGSWTSALLALWVILNLIWNSVIIEIWKRKTNEINFRWGSVKIETEDDKEAKTLREEFVGDEQINHISGELTKKRFEGSGNIFKFIQIPVFLSLGLAVIGTFLVLKIFQQIYANNNLFQILGSILQAIVIQILNHLFNTSAKYVK